MNCERCKKDVKRADAVPVTYGETDIALCYDCAVELTLVLGHWLSTEPADVQANLTTKT